MAFVAFEDCIRAEIRFLTADGNPMEVTLWYRSNFGAINQESVDGAAEILDDAVHNSWKPLISASVTYKEVYVRDMTAAISFQAVNSANAGVGTRAGSAVEDHSAMCVLRKSGLVGRSANGRIYLPGGVSTDRVSPSRWTVAYAGLWATEMGDTDALFAAGWTPIVASRRLKIATGQVLLSTFEITAWEGVLNIASIRNRSS